MSKQKTCLILVLAFAALLRLYYFFVTRDQPLWWDEAEYALMAKSLALGTPDSGFWSGRPILFSILLSPFYYLGLGEDPIRLFLLLASMGSVILVYAIGARMFGENVGLIASFLYSLEFINLFYSMRIMTDMLHVALGLLAIYFFLCQKTRLTWLVLPVLAVGTLIRFTTILILPVLVVYLALVEGRSFLARREYRRSAVLALLVFLPYLIWSQVKFHNPFHAFLVGGGHVAEDLSFPSGLGTLMQYLAAFPASVHVLLLAFFVFEALFFYDVLFGFDAVVEGRDPAAAHRFFLMVWIGITLACYGFGVERYVDRYIALVYPAVFLMVALGVERTRSFIELGQRYQKHLPKAFLVSVLTIGGFQLWSGADGAIKAKATSYDEVRQAGEWIKERSSPGDKVLTMSAPQITFYSERESHLIPASEAEFVTALASLKPRYVVLSVLEEHPRWVYDTNLEAKYGLKPVKPIPVEKATVVVFERSP